MLSKIYLWEGGILGESQHHQPAFFEPYYVLDQEFRLMKKTDA